MAHWKNTGNEIAQLVFDKIQAQPSNVLRGLVQTKRWASQTNCWWALYDMRGAISEMAKVELENRRIAKEASAPRSESGARTG
jgi:hypothetical protein